MTNSADVTGNLQPSQSVSMSEDCRLALEEAERVADEERKKNKDRPKDERSNTVSVLRTRGTKKMVSGRSRGRVDSGVEKTARSKPPNLNNCKCAELNCITKAFEKKILPVGEGNAVIVAVDVRSETDSKGKHGKKKPACSVCAQVLLDYGILEC